MVMTGVMAANDNADENNGDGGSDGKGDSG